MRWQSKVKPPNREHYLNRCAALKRCLNTAEFMPPFLVCANCWFVLEKALGNDWLVLRWAGLLDVAHVRELWTKKASQPTANQMPILMDTERRQR